MLWCRDSTQKTLHSVGLLCTSDRPVTEISTRQPTTLTKETSVSLLGFEPAVPEIEQSQIHAIDCTATGLGF